MSRHRCRIGTGVKQEVVCVFVEAMFCDGLNTNIDWIPDNGFTVLNPVYTGVFAKCCESGYVPIFDPERKL